MAIKQGLFRLARSRFGRFCISFLFTHMSFVIPVKRLHETDSVMAFHHPQPSYPLHILIVAKRPYATLMEINTADSLFLADLMATVQTLVRQFALQESGYRLITNGGLYQDVPQLHFHLIADSQ